MTSTQFQLSINPSPASLSPATIQTMFADMARLHQLSPLAKVLMAQDQELEPRDVNLLQIYFQDGRKWLDEIEYKDGVPSPWLTRASTGDQFSSDEWNQIVKVRLSIHAAHTFLGDPSLIQFIYATDFLTTLTPTESTAVHSSGSLHVAWHSPLVGHHDWIALFKVGDPNTAYVEGHYTYVADGAVDGAWTVPVPATPGTYEFRYLVADSYTSIIASAPIVVT